MGSNLTQRQGSETRLHSLYDASLPLSSPSPGPPHTPKRTLTVGRAKPPCDSHPPDSHCRPRAKILQRRYLWLNGGVGVGIVRERQQHAGYRIVGSTVLPGARVTLVHRSRMKTPAQLSVWFCLYCIHYRRQPAVERRGRPATSTRTPSRHVFTVREIWRARACVTLVHRSRMKTPVQLSV